MTRHFALFLTAATIAMPVAAQTIAIVGGTVISDPATPPITNATVLVSNGKIVSVGKAVAVPQDAQRIDATGRIVTAGLMASETTLGLVEINSASASNHDTSGNSPFGAAFDVSYVLNPDSVLLPHVRADGLTRAVAAPGRPKRLAFSGMGSVIRLVDGPAILDKPRAMMMLRIGGSPAANGARADQWLYAREALDEAKAFVAGSPDSDPRDRLLGRADVRALRGVLSRQIPLAIEVSRASDIRQSIALATDYGIRIVIIGGEEAWRVAPELAAKRIPVVLDPGVDGVIDYDAIGGRSDNAAILHRSGVTIAFMTNLQRGSWDGGAALREGAGFAVAAGLPPSAALAAMTSNPAKIWGVDDHYGTLAAGRDADVVVWDGDPLQVTTSATAVLVRGKPVSLLTRDLQLSRRYAQPQRK